MNDQQGGIDLCTGVDYFLSIISRFNRETVKENINYKGQKLDNRLAI